MSLKSYVSVLKNVNFAKLWVSQAASQLTNYLLSFAILIQVFRLTNSSASVAIIITAFGLGTVFFGSIAGVAADRFDRKWLLTIINFAQAGCIGLYFLIGGSFWPLVFITFLYSALNQFYIPAEAPSIPNLVPKPQILVANSYFVFTGSVALIIGFAGSGPLIIFFGAASPFFLGAILLTIAGLATLMLPSIPPEKKSDHPFAPGKVWHEFKEGVSHVWENSRLHYPLLSLIGVQIVLGMLITIAPAFIERAIGVNLERGSLLVVAPLGLGMLIAALSMGFEEHKLSKTKLVLIGFLGMGAMVMCLSFINFFQHKFFYYSSVAVLVGFFNAHIFAPSHSIIQHAALSHFRGRIYGTLSVLLQIASTVPTLLAGELADHIPLAFVMAGLGGLLLIFGLILVNLPSSRSSIT